MIDSVEWRRMILGVAVVLFVGFGGAYAMGFLGAPSVENVENRFGDVNNTTTIIETDLIIQNPNPIGLQLGGVTTNYTVDLNSVRIASGTKSGVNVTTGNSTLAFQTAMNNEQIPAWWTSHIENGEQSALRVHATVTSAVLGRNASFAPVDRPINTDILSAFNSDETRPVNANQPLVNDPVLYINETSATWGAVSDRETPIDMEFVAYNPKIVPYTITEIGYTITMNNLSIGEGRSETEYVLPPHETTTIDTTTIMLNQRLDDWWVTHLERNQITDLRIDFYARIELPSGDIVRVPLDALTYTETIETDFFGTKPQTQPPNEQTPSDDTSSKDSEPTTTDSHTTTETTTETPTPTPTPTPTETDDGILLNLGA